MSKRSPPRRTICLVREPDATGIGVFCLITSKKTEFYVFREIPSEIGGRGFALHRLGVGTLYHTRVGEPAECDCDCLGFLAHGTCKHVLGLRALIEDRLL